MKLNFRQGIVRHQTDILGTPTFLSVSGGFVSLIISPDPTIVAFIHGTKDYLYTERQTVSNAWGPFSTGSDYWLYWQLNQATGLREFGHTTLEPIETANPPSSPGIGQMWFNIMNNTWYDWNGASWVEVIRVFACRLENGMSPKSMSINAPAFTGTQVGLTTSRRIGSLAFDSDGKPIRSGDRKFFTTEDRFVTGVPSGASLSVGNIIIPGIAQEPLGEYSVVEYFDFNKLVHASPFTQGSKLYGFVEEGAHTGELVNFVTEGMIVNDDWDWVVAGADVNDPVYNDGTGQISLTPAIPDQLPVGVVTGRHEILFAPRLFPQVNPNITIPLTFPELTDTPTDYTGAAGQFVRVNPTEDGLLFSTALQQVNWGMIGGTLSNQLDLDLALTGKSDVGHTHVEAEIADLDKYTQNEVDVLLLNKSDVGHTHVEADIIDLDKYSTTQVQAFLALKADISHTHVEAEITDLDKYTQDEVDTLLLGKLTTGANVGTGTGTIFRDKTGTTANFKTLIAGTNITITNNADDITIEASGGGGGGLPASTTECSVLVADDAAGWVERAPQFLPEYAPMVFSKNAPYGASEMIGRYMVTDNMILLDYGHRAIANNGGPAASLDNFVVRHTGSSFATVGFTSSLPFVSVDFTNGMAELYPGDDIAVTTPASADPSLDNVGITLRAFKLPAVPCGTLTVGFSSAEYEEADTINVSVTGACSHLEYAVVAISTDDGGTWLPFDDDLSAGSGALPVLDFISPAYSFQPSSCRQYYATLSTQCELSKGGFFGGGDRWFTLRVVAFGPAGYDTATTTLKLYDIGS
jgi:hypothetical protein